MRCLRCFFKISWDEVREDKITNLIFRNEFNGIDSIKIFIAKIILLFWKNVRMKCNCVITRLIATSKKDLWEDQM